ncbi:MAG TPA: PspA/IM30 family protein [Streptosporangiaceae bacterium]|nr:PspA/IM30 family protein [Streptosporangiaceae bacterium]
MGYLLRMSGEIRDWLADLRDSDPPAAAQVGHAVVALIEEGASLGPPLVISLADPASSANPTEALDGHYHDRLEQLEDMRRHLAEAQALVRDIEQQVAELQSLEAKLADQRWRSLQAGRPEEAAEAVDKLAEAQSKLAELRQILPGAVEAEQQLRKKHERLQASVDAFRTRKETLRASYVAAQAQHEIRDAITALSRDVGFDAGLRDGSDASDTEAAARLQEASGQIRQELGRWAWPDGLMELRPGAPGDSDIRILFAVEPAGTALLIAVLEGHEAVREQREEAVELSAEMLHRVREGQAPEAAAHAFDDAQSFLDEFFPGSADEVGVGAAALMARNRGRTLAQQRARLGLSQEEVAQRMGMRRERVAAIERAEPGATEVRTLARYVQALGGRLEIIADFGEERVVLR